MHSKRFKQVQEFFHAYLRQNGLKKTHQKDLILETFLDAEGHLSVEDVYDLVKKRDKRVGVVTVFRTLKSLTACGLAREVNLGDGLTRFEHAHRHPDHHHIVCTQCRRAIEFVSPELERLQQEIVERYRFEPVLLRFQIYGVCRECREKRPARMEARHDTERIFERDALRMALAMERQGLEFYRDAAERNQDPAGREILRQVADEEEKHLRQLEASLLEIEQQEKGIDQAPAFLHFDSEQLKDLLPDLSAYVTDGGLRLDARSSLEMALTLESRSADFFRRFAETFGDTAGKEVFRKFAEREMQHCEVLNRFAHSGPA
jgi:Fur family ferric uptake transcriptional regulator